MVVVFWAITCWISYVAGMSKGFQTFLTTDPNSKFTNLDAAVYSQISGKKLDDINPVAEMLADKRIQDFKDRKKIEKRNAVVSKLKKKKSKKK
tara:strand:- start:16 stop:294 length:279 start_codon:yes stop_codon:yes gene_type:complete